MKSIPELKDAIVKEREKGSHNATGKMEKEDREVLSTINRKLFILQIIVVILSTLTVFLLITLIILGIFYGSSAECIRGYPVIERNYNDPGMFDGLTVEEYEMVYNFMLSTPSLNIVPYNKVTTINCSYIFMIDLLIPLKAAVLRQLGRGDKKPKRSAKVVVFRGDSKPPRVEEYHVGPLPNPEYFRAVTNPSYTTPRIPFTARPMSQIEYNILFQILNEVCEELYFLLSDSYGLSYHNCTGNKDCIIFQDTAPRGIASGERQTWFVAFRDVEGYYLHPLGLEIKIKHDSINMTDWTVVQLFYNGMLFDSTEELLLRYKLGHIQKIKLSTLAFIEHFYSSYKRRGESDQAVPLQGPKLVEPDGRRFQVTGNHIKYLHWDFNVHMRSSTGLQLFDVRFQEERIIYELSLQDAVVFYSGFGPSQSTNVHYDASLLMGRMNFELVPGVDCPDTAVFLDTHSFVDTGKPKLYKNVICIFENNAGIPLRRHFTSDKAGNFKQYGGLVNHCLIVRTITSVWSYDFIFDYIFYQNGGIEVKISKTGYVESTFNLRGDEKYGYHLHDDVIANIHQHLFHYKIDLDINGEQNRFATIDVAVKRKENPWNLGKNITSFWMVKNDQDREQDIIYDREYSKSRFNIIYNKKATSKFGSYRAYRILNLAATEHILENSDIANAARWAKYPIAVTKYQDAEEMSTSIYAQNDPWNPVVDFDRFLLNNESIIDQDIVSWVTMGSIHIPHTEDVPSVSTPGNQLSFFLLPFNYYTECPSVSSPNAVRITPNDEESVNIETYGTSFESSCVQHKVGPFQYKGQWETVDTE